jgi:nitric oxide reductase subunit B
MLMIVLNIFPAGVIQMIASYKEGFWFARSPEFMHSHLFQMFTWARIAGDITFVVIGVLPLVVLVVRGMFHLRPAVSAPPEPSLGPESQNV